MSKSRPPVAPDVVFAFADYPQAIQWNCNQRAAELVAIADIDSRLPALEAEIDRMQRELDDAKGHHARFGRERSSHVDNAELLHGLVRGWCQENNVPMPPEPVVPAAPPAPEPGPLEIPVTHMADVLVSNGGPYPQETREQPAVDPLEPLAPGVIDSRADVTTPDTDKEADGG